MIVLFLKGLLIGLAIAAPVGPIAILCIQRSLHEGFKIGLATGMGAAIADGTYGLIAGLGMTSLSTFLITHQFWIRLIGGLFLLYLGVRLFLANPKDRSINDSERSPFHAFFTTFLLTLANPATILAFIAIFAALGLGITQTDYVHAIILISGITLGSALWWLTLSGGVAFILHHRLTSSFIHGINRISGSVIFIFGLLALSMK